MIDMDYVFTTEHKEVFETVEEAQPYADQLEGTVVAVFLQDGFGAYYTKEDGIFLGYEIKTPEGDYFDAEDCFCECDGGEESTINNNDDEEDDNMSKPRTVEFNIESKDDSRIYLKGNFDLDHMADTNEGDWEYEQNDGTYASHLPRYWKVNGKLFSMEYDVFIGCIDFEQLRKDLFKYANENRTIDCGEYLLHINDGAKMECEIEKPSNFRGDYIVEVIPQFNGEKVDLISYMNEMGEIFDPFGNNEPTSCTEDGHIYFEIPKSYCEGDSEDKQYIINEINEEARRIFARALTYKLGVYAKYGDMMEQALDDDYDNAWLYKLNTVKHNELDSFLKKEGLVDELI